MADKIVCCRCEDVTLYDVAEAIRHGYADIEEVKRYTGFGTGPCQGKECMAVVATLLAERTARPPAEIKPFTTRPPLVATPLKYFAGEGAAQLSEQRDDDAHDEDHGMAG